LDVLKYLVKVTDNQYFINYFYRLNIRVFFKLFNPRLEQKVYLLNKINT